VPDAVFPFPGGKSRLASWILEYVSEHTCFVEIFGGAAGVLVNKDPTRVPWRCTTTATATICRRTNYGQ
jgi:site-specific DNA-adenine methylase